MTRDGFSKKVRYRIRLNASPKEGHRQTWGEYQVVRGREVIGRYEMLEQALRAHPDAQPDASC